VSEEEDPAVSRRQFFRGVTGDFLRAIGELSGIDRLEEHLREPVVLTELDQMVAPERQAAAMTEIFGFLENLDLGKGQEPEPHEEAQRNVEAVAETPAEPEPPAEPEAPVEHEVAAEHDPSGQRG
jgi:hypothetical protein